MCWMEDEVYGKLAEVHSNDYLHSNPPNDNQSQTIDVSIASEITRKMCMQSQRKNHILTNAPIYTL